MRREQAPANQADTESRNEQTEPGLNTATVCHLCGSPLPDSPRILSTAAERFFFCCRGCLHVFQILSATTAPGTDFHRTELFRDCAASGLIPGRPASGPDQAGPRPETGEEVHACEFTQRIEGMWCLSCAWVIEERLRRTKGVLAARVDFFADLLEVRYLPQYLGPEEIRRCVSRLGYRLHDNEGSETAAGRRQLLRLGIAAILSANVMMLSFPLYGGFSRELDQTGLGILSLPLLLLTTPVLFYSGWPILVRGLRGLAGRCFTMDGLIAVGGLAAYGYSVYQMANQGAHLYFDTVAMLITLVLLGRFIEQRARTAFQQGVHGLRELGAGKVRVLRQSRPSWVAADTLEYGEHFLVETEERIVADGRVVTGEAEVDEAILTGEARPVAKKAGDQVLAGSMLRHGQLQVEASRVGRNSTVGRLLALVQQSLRSKNQLEELADRLTRRFVPAIFLLAAATGILLLFQGQTTEEALLRALTVLIISCPCALGIAAPLAKVAIIGRARNLGIIIRNTTAFEQTRNLDTLVFDKTGTVTEGRYTLRTVRAPGCGEAQALARAAAVEEGADHFLGRELRRRNRAAGRSDLRAAERSLHPGLGVSGVVNGEVTAVGNRELMTHFGLRLPEELAGQGTAAEEEGGTVVFLGWHGKVEALFVFDDVIRPGMKELLAGLADAGIELHLLSGDSPTTTSRAANRLGIDNHAGWRLPEDKVAYIRSLRAAGKRVGMIGDGINDSGALAQAEVGVAVGGNLSRLLAEGADVTLPVDPVRLLPEVLHLSRLMATAIRGNLAFALIYNAIAIPLAALGLLNPSLAACAMFLSSLTVIANTRRLAGKGGKLAALEGLQAEGEVGGALPMQPMPVKESYKL
jgi:heavy metal translocating P-type ATPase